MILDAFVQSRLRDGGIVHFAVAVAAIANQVHDDVAAESGAIVRGDLPDANDGVWIFGVHVENRNGLALGDIGGESRGVLLHRPRGEADQIVDDDVNRAADGVGLEVGEIQRFRQNSLARKRGVAVHHDGNNFVGVEARRAAGIAGLLCARAAHSDRIDGFQMAGIRNQVNVDFFAVRGDVSARLRRRDISRRRRRARCADRHLQIRRRLRAESCTRCAPSRSGGRDGSWP